ncbi:DNA (cytosine-5-)-methyltransferase [Gammaproteobacteria bacterium]|nr:DNA (cytosine-5-)-methyltransferase [Gammaproteobacteria bacterium]
MTTSSKLKVIELFAGVGGFRIGLEGYKGKSSSSNYTKKLSSNYKIVWGNQWEPGTKVQHAADVYIEKFGDAEFSNEDITKVETKDIPDHDLLVGGFPCQDYSVAMQLNRSKGIQGKKGVLWWEIHRILSEKKRKKPNYLLLENVDRLIKSPVTQRGKDFALMLASLSDLGYIVEWRVINAADYGMPQRRRRVFIFGFHKTSELYKKYKSSKDWSYKDGVLAKAFPVIKEKSGQQELFEGFEIKGDLVEITKNFNKERGSVGIFENSGIMDNRNVVTYKVKPNYKGKKTTLKDIIIPYKDVAHEYFLSESDLDKWKYMKGAKKEPRKKSNGEVFYYCEGPMSFPDPLDRPARTIITSEGGITPSRFKHVIEQRGKLRRLTPIELERANMFPDNHTDLSADTKRSFFMGNALVIGIVEKIGKTLNKFI